ncbi:hypothetical protein [Lacticaseibacillus paracasei]|uniref:hypothetical protein n=1 Tax=Lacticaseibacillus paracasei TaxID=1597 RepID=UPI001CDACDA3|nr:hypothetical protein [Lacticaseibacillus paracasei]WRM20711.1 hypothetical protein T1M39_03125 [Lacticaseibacillus paracasei]
MSRSFKKHPVVKDWRPGMKQRASHSARVKMKQATSTIYLLVKVIVIGGFTSHGIFLITRSDMIFTKRHSH